MDGRETRWLIPLGLVLLATLAGCSDTKEVRNYREIVPSSETPPVVVRPNQSASSRTIQWHSPEGWQAGPASGMRLASFQIDAETLCTIIALDGNAGELDANVKRWIGQIGITDVNDSDFQAVMGTTRDIQAQDGIVFKVVDLTQMASDGNSIIGAIAALPGKTLFVKLTGPVENIKALERPYLELLRSFHFTQVADPHAGHDHPPSAAEPAAEKRSPLAWKSPGTWLESPGSGMRLVTFRPEPEDGTECYITVMPGDVGGLEKNVAWWATQLGLSLEGDQLKQFLAEQATVEAGGVSYRLVDYTGLAPDSDTESMIVAMGMLTDRTVFVKMNGPRENVIKQRIQFMDLVKSLTHN
jgi:hypothetical protein